MTRMATARSCLASRAGILACGALATLAGAAYLVLAGAPVRYPAVNLAALLAGLILVALTAPLVDRRFDALALPLLVSGALLLLATTILGVEVDGATRWIRAGPLTLQPALVLVPGLLILYAQRPTTTGTAAIAATAAALALQPDRSVAAALALGLLVLLLAEPRRQVLVAFTAAIGGVVAAFLQPDALIPVEHVEGVQRAALASGPVESILVIGGGLLLLAPALAGAFDRSARGLLLRVFGTTWLALSLAALVGPYPTPLLGYGSSAILGYLLSGLLLRDDAA